jgi:hypothetical protein
MMPLSLAHTVARVDVPTINADTSIRAAALKTGVVCRIIGLICLAAAASMLRAAQIIPIAGK